MSKALVFYRVVKAEKGHPCAGLYSVEKVYIREDKIYKKERVHEWDLRIISEAILAKLGGSTAYDAYTEDHKVEDMLDPATDVVEARTKEDLKDLTKRKLANELRLKD